MREQVEKWSEDSVPEKTGLAWFFALLLRRFWDFFRASLLLLVGVVPGVLLTIWGIWGHSHDPAVAARGTRFLVTLL